MSGFTRTAGRLCVAGGLIGAAAGLVTAFVEPAVPIDRWSYPYEPPGFFVAETAFLLNHVLLLVGLLGLARCGAVGSGKLGRVGVWTAIVGMAGLSMCEVAAMTLVNSAYPSPETDLLESFYGLTTIMIGAGLTAAGTAVARKAWWTGWRRYLPLGTGLAVFVVVVPSLLGPVLIGRLGLTAWMLMWTALGAALVASTTVQSSDRLRPTVNA